MKTKLQKRLDAFYSQSQNSQRYIIRKIVNNEDNFEIPIDKDHNDFEFLVRILSDHPDADKKLKDLEFFVFKYSANSRDYRKNICIYVVDKYGNVQDISYLVALGIKKSKGVTHDEELQDKVTTCVKSKAIDLMLELGLTLPSKYAENLRLWSHRALPWTERKSGIYWIYDECGYVMYIGKTNNLYRRMCHDVHMHLDYNELRYSELYLNFIEMSTKEISVLEKCYIAINKFFQPSIENNCAIAKSVEKNIDNVESLVKLIENYLKQEELYV